MSHVNTDLPSNCLPIWARRKLVTRIFAEAKALGGEARIVGGAVRDWLAGYPVVDIDMAVNLPIKTLMSHFLSSNISVVESGLQHGTITLCDDYDAIEVTQTRVDLQTDGRHAIVEHDRDWLRDAARRDFTINAIYLDAGGKIFDPLGGQADLRSGSLRFNGEAGQRVKEDALRIIRYCRLLPRFERTGATAEMKMVLTDNAGLCANLSGERIAKELRQIMVGGRLAVVAGLMRETQIDYAALGIEFNLLPLDIDDCFDRIVGRLGWLAGLAAVMPAGSARALAERLCLSRSESRCLARLDVGISHDQLLLLGGPRWRQGAYYLGDFAAMLFVVQSWRNLSTVDTQRLSEILVWKPPKRPLSGADLLSHGVDNGPALGQMLKEAEIRWVESNFTIKKPALMEWLSRI